MKVLFLNNYDRVGGAAKASYRLFDSLYDFGMEAKMLVRFKTGNNKNVIEINSYFNILNKLRIKIENLLLKKYKNRKGDIFSSAILKSFLTKKIKKINPDIIHIHWIGSSFVDIKSLLDIKKPIVWTLHDSWVFTGGCHVPYSCKKYETKCSKCPALGSNKENDLSSLVWENKKGVYEKLDMNIVSPSSWLAACAKSSSLLFSKRISVVPNGIDVNLFSKLSGDLVIKGFKFDKNVKYILFSGNVLDANKNFGSLLESLKFLKDKNNLEIFVVGSDEGVNSKFVSDIKINYLGYIKNELELISIYNFAKVVVVPSKQENLPNTIIESFACYTPVIAFNIGGNADIIDHKINGYLAKLFDTFDFAQGIDWILNNENYDDLCENARKKVLEKFDIKIVAKQYIDLYKSILNK